LKELTKVTPKYLASLNQEELDQLYARLGSGDSDGPSTRDHFSARQFGQAARRRNRRGLAAGRELQGQNARNRGRNAVEGKVFYRDQKILRNRIQDIAVLRPVIGPATFRKSTSTARTPGCCSRQALLRQSLIDSRRESIIIDYAFTDELPGYRERPDFLAGRRGLKVRDEIRMVRPGLYLGRAYMDHAFVLDFVLYNKKLDQAGRAEFETGQVKDECWSGTQKRIVANR